MNSNTELWQQTTTKNYHTTLPRWTITMNYDDEVASTTETI